MEGFAEGGGDPERLTLVPDREAAWNVIASDLGLFSTILVKGSRMMRMELIADQIVEEK